MLARRPSGGRTAVLAACIRLAAGTAGAAEVKLKAGEITSLLAGNSVTGDFRGAAYAQYFDPDGSTLMAIEEAPPESGKWKVDAEKNEYCSWWAATGWRCYAVTRDGDILYWQREGAAQRSQSSWAEGNLLSK
jgi:hypothetical protein